MTRRLACTVCLESKRETAFSIQLGRRVCQPCQDRELAAGNDRLRKLAALDPWRTGVDTQPFPLEAS